MTDAPDLTPEQDAVRRLLTAARHDGPTPPEVVARLDDVLASLVAERRETGAGDTHPPVVDLGARRRRTAGMALLAAAAVVVAGVAIGQGLPQMSGEDAGSSAGGDMATSQDLDTGGPAEGPGNDDGSSESQLAPESLKSTVPTPVSGYPTLSSLAGDLDGALLDLRTTKPATSAGVGVPDALVACDLRGIGPGRRVAAEVDGQDGVVVFRRASGDSQDVALYVCGDSEPVRTLTLPAR